MSAETFPVIRDSLAAHFVMWRELTGPDTPPGEWFCSCGLKFGFSDSAIDHQATSLYAALTRAVA